MTAPKPPTALELREALTRDVLMYRIRRDEFARDIDAMLAAARAEAVAPLEARVKELTEALRGLVEAMPKCHVCYGTGTMPIRCTMCHDSTWDHECNDRNVPCTACSSSAAPLRAALLLLAKGGR